jgi:hypothetical protein
MFQTKSHIRSFISRLLNHLTVAEEESKNLFC